MNEESEVLISDELGTGETLIRWLHEAPIWQAVLALLAENVLILFLALLLGGALVRSFENRCFACSWQMNPTSNGTPRFQFSVATALCIITSVVILCLFARLGDASPHWTIFPCAILFSACLFSRRRISPDLTWCLFTITWLNALIQAMRSMIFSFDVGGCKPPSASDFQRALLIAYVSNLALPLFLSFPAACYVFRGPRGPHFSGRKWLIVCSVVGLIDVTVLTVSLDAIIESTLR